MLEGIVGPAGTGRGAEEGAAAAADPLAIRTHQRPGTIPMLGTTWGMQQCWLQLLHQPLLPPWATFYSFLGCKMGS